MIYNSPPGVVRHRGLTLLELTVVIATLLVLVSVLFIGSRAWKRGCDRAGCVLTLHNVQVATRSYQNIYGYTYGSHPNLENGTQDIAKQLYARGYIEAKLYQQVTSAAPCPAGGIYTRAVPDIFPLVGQLYVTCSLSVSDDHVPASHEDW